MLSQEVKSKINKLWDHFWSGGLANPLTAIEQITYLIFMKRLEELDNFGKERAEARGEKFKSLFDGTTEVSGRKIDNASCRWSHWKHFSAEQMLTHVHDNVFPFIKNIRRNGNGDFAAQMQDAAFMIPKPSLLQEAVSIIDGLKIPARNYDVLGDLYEYLLSELSSAGKAGQFRTPRHIIRMMIELLDIDIGERVCDPACGTAGFLVSAYQHVLKKYTSPDLIKVDAEGVSHNLIGDKISNKNQWNLLKREMFFGFDFDSIMVKIASMNMIMHGIENPNIVRMDTLSKAFDQKQRFDVILANPPFTGSIDLGDIHDDLKLRSGKTELLFLELFYNLLHIGGRAAVIVPNGVLFGSSNAHKKIRKLLLEKCQLEAVISMPSGVFKPYSGVGTAVLVFVKGGNTEKVWFYDMQSDGFSLDDKRVFIDGKGDIQDIIAKYMSKTVGPNSLLVSFDNIKDSDYNLSISRYKEIEHEEITYEKPLEIIDRILGIDEEISNELIELKKLIK